MPIQYDHLYFRSHAQSHRFLIPGDETMAADYGFKKYPLPPFQPLDHVAITIAQIVAEKGWNLPDTKVTFRSGGYEDEPIHTVSKIEGGLPGEKWRIEYGRSGHFANDGETILNTLPNRFCVPGHDFKFDTNSKIVNSGRYYRYVGNNWPMDEEAFLSEKGSAKKYGRPRSYLYYRREGETLVNDQVYGTEYKARDGEPAYVTIPNLQKELVRFFNGVAKDLMKLPNAAKAPYAQWQEFIKIDPTPAPRDMPTFYATRYSPSDPKKDVILPRGGYLFFSGAPYDDSLPAPARNCYYYGFQDPPYASETGLWGVDPRDENTSVYEINVKHANDIFVADETVCSDGYESVADRLAHKDGVFFTEEEELAMVMGVMKTLTPLAEYKGNFKNKKHFILIGRPLWSDEARDITADVRRAVENDPSRNIPSLNLRKSP